MTNDKRMEVRIRERFCYENMLLIWHIVKTFTLEVKATYLLLNVAVLQTKSEIDRFEKQKVFVN